MAYCTKCGNTVADTAKFCTKCGNTISALPTPGSETAYSPVYEPAKKSNSTAWIIAGAIVLTGAIIAYVFYTKNSTPAPVVENNISGDSVAVATVIKDSPPVPLNPETKEVETAITQVEIDQVSKKIQEFYDYENKEDVSNLLSYYEFPLVRYYNIYDVSYDKLYGMVTEAFNGKLFYHNIDIKWNYSQVQKLAEGGYKVLMFAEYTSASEDQGDHKTKNINLVIILNDSYKITSIYPNK